MINPYASTFIIAARFDQRFNEMNHSALHRPAKPKRERVAWDAPPSWRLP
jgi:hypothetical protein